MTKDDVIKTIAYVILEEAVSLSISNDFGAGYDLDAIIASLKDKLSDHLVTELDQANKRDYLDIQDKYIKIIQEHFEEVTNNV